MSQYWGAPNPPPPRPQYQLPPPETGYYYPQQGDSTGKRALMFMIGSCSTLLLVGCCICVLAVGWVVDERFGITTPKDEITEATTTVDSAFSEPAGSQAMLSTPTPVTNVAPPVLVTPQAPVSNKPFAIGQMILANDVTTELVALDIQRNVQPNNFAAAPGMEFVAVSVQIRSTEPADFAKLYQPTDFQLQNGQNVFYQPDPEADNGRRLPSGELPQNGSPIEGDLLFHIPMGEAPLFLVWQNTGSAEQYTIILQ